ncbi:MAG: LysR family transcriptional regulator [Rhodospirillales bacterium]|nr:LysR family transcriptional regulator [Rhodospirillales bacterium]
MDIDLARTFLAIVETGNFNRAAEQVNVTQSTVSMRIKSLEDILGQELFIRSKVGTTLTGPGLMFRKYAETLVRTWEQARQEISLPEEYEGTLAIGGQFTLWDRLLLKWIPWMQTAVPDMAIRAEVGLSDGLMRQLLEGLLDIGVMYMPFNRPGFAIEELMNEKLIMVSTQPSPTDPDDKGFIYVDWGVDFRVNFSNAFPNADAARLTVSHGPLGLRYILDNGGAGYFPMRLVRSHLKDNQLFSVEDAPVFMRPAYIVYPEDREDERFKTALQGLRYVAAMETED